MFAVHEVKCFKYEYNQDLMHFICSQSQYESYGLVGDAHHAQPMLKPGMPQPPNTLHPAQQPSLHPAQQPSLHPAQQPTLHQGQLPENGEQHHHQQQQHLPNTHHQQADHDHGHQHGLNDAHTHGNEEVASRYGQLLPVQSGYAPQLLPVQPGYGHAPHSIGYQPAPAHSHYAPAPQPQYIQQPQYAPYPQPQYAAPIIPYGTYAYPSAAPQPQCGSNLLFSCAPRVQQVPCSSSYGSYGQAIAPFNNYGVYRAADENTLGMMPDDGSVHQPEHQQPHQTPNLPHANPTTTNTTTTNSTLTPGQKPGAGIPTEPVRLGDAPKEMSFNADKLDNANPNDGAQTQIEDAERKLDGHKKPIAVHHVPVPVPIVVRPPPILPPYHYQPQPPAYHPTHQTGYRDGSGNTMPQTSSLSNNDNTNTKTNVW